jgi:hypothetical protein
MKQTPRRQTLFLMYLSPTLTENLMVSTCVNDFHAGLFVAPGVGVSPHNKCLSLSDRRTDACES